MAYMPPEQPPSPGSLPRPPRIHRLTAWVIAGAGAFAVALDVYSLLRRRKRPLRTRR
jgi:hypothetical protein